MNIDQIVGALEERAKRVGLSIAAVCARTGNDGRKPVAPSTVSRWKAGDCLPRLAILSRLDAVIAAEEAEQARQSPPPPEQDRVLSAVA